MKKIFLNVKFNQVVNVVDFILLIALCLNTFGIYDNITRIVGLVLSALLAVFSVVALYQLHNWSVANATTEKHFLESRHKGQLYINIAIFLILGLPILSVGVISRAVLLLVAIILGIVGLVYMTRFFNLSKKI